MLLIVPSVLRYDTVALRALLFFLLPFLLLAQTPLQDAVSLVRAKHYEEARDKLAHVPEPSETPQRIAFHRLKAAIASGLGDGAAAAGEMQAALSLAPSDPSLLTGTALAEKQIGHLDQALSLALRAGDNALAKAMIGDIQESRSHWSESIEAYQQAVALDPSRESYRAVLGLALIRHGAFEQAVGTLRQSVSVFPHSGGLLTLLAISVYAIGEPKEPEQLLHAAIAADPAYDPAYRCLSKIVLESSAVPSSAIVSALCNWDKVVCSALQLRVARESGDGVLQDKAMETLARAPEKNTVARCALGQAYEWKGDLPKARREMETCAVLDPSPQNHYRLGLLYRRLGETSLAQKQMEARRELLGKMSEESAAVLSTLPLLSQKP